jgi:hypothetical protein
MAAKMQAFSAALEPPRPTPRSRRFCLRDGSSDGVTVDLHTRFRPEAEGRCS